MSKIENIFIFIFIQKNKIILKWVLNASKAIIPRFLCSIDLFLFFFIFFYFYFFALKRPSKRVDIRIYKFWAVFLDHFWMSPPHTSLAMSSKKKDTGENQLVHKITMSKKEKERAHHFIVFHFSPFFFFFFVFL